MYQKGEISDIKHKQDFFVTSDAFHKNTACIVKAVI